MAGLSDLINQYKTKVETGYTPTDYSASYEQVGQNIKDAYDAKYQGDVLQLNAQQAQQDKQYRAGRTETYIDARKAATGANEQLASLGLARGLYDGPASGVSEVSRTQQDIGLQKNINALNTGQMQMQNDIAHQILATGYTKDVNVAQQLAANELSKLSAQQSENQFSASYDQNAYDTLINQYYQELAAQQQAQQLEYQKQQAATANAYAELSSYGKIVTQGAANALGVAVGTTTKQLKKGK